jgi:hypothetical protein
MPREITDEMTQSKNILKAFRMLEENMVRTERLELSHLAAPEPKPGVSTNFTTSANTLEGNWQSNI